MIYLNQVMFSWTGNGEIEKIYHNYILTGKDKGANYGTISGCD